MHYKSVMGGFRAAHRNRSVEVHIVTDVLFTGMVISCLIQLVLNSSVATHIVLFTGIYAMQPIHVSGFKMHHDNINIAYNLYKA